MTTEFNFAAWMLRHRLTDHDARRLLKISLASVRNYRRGHRPDQKVPVVVPSDVVARCVSLDERSAGSRENRWAGSARPAG